MSLVDTNKNDRSIYTIAEGLINSSKIRTVSLSGSGANSRIYKVETIDNIYALKFYREGIFNDRLNSERKALNLFHENGIFNVPQIYNFDLKNNCILMEWVDGEIINKPDIGDINNLSEFIISVDKVKNSINLEAHMEATEACLSASELMSQIKNRIDKLEDSDSTELFNFIRHHLSPLFEEVSYWVCDYYTNLNMSSNDNLDIEFQTLSVVDFGFHNAMKKNNGDTIFIDFEYFGLDDPVKLVSDTLLHPHPLMNLSNEFRQNFFDKTLGYFNKDGHYYNRVKALYPLYTLRWCTIMLNSFLPNYVFVDSNSNQADLKKIIQDRKLSDVKAIVLSLSNNYNNFPFGEK
jgi:thiamine kinase-like enzyme